MHTYVYIYVRIVYTYIHITYPNAPQAQRPGAWGEPPKKPRSTRPHPAFRSAPSASASSPWGRRVGGRAQEGRPAFPKPETRNPKPETINPQSETRNQKTETQNPKPETRNHKSPTRNPKTETRNHAPNTLNPEPETRNPQVVPAQRHRRCASSARRPRSGNIYIF